MPNVEWHLLQRGPALAAALASPAAFGRASGSDSVLEAARLASLVSNHLSMPAPGSLGNKNNGNSGNDSSNSEVTNKHHHDTISPSERARARLGVEEVLYLATRGGAKVLGLQDRVGAFDVGMEWDAQLVRLGAVVGDGDAAGEDMEDYGNVDFFGWETWEERIAKWVYNGDDRNTRRVWVRGRLVHERR